jgi:hypothetical protein
VKFIYAGNSYGYSLDTFRGPSHCQWSDDKIWILGATDSRGLHGMYTTSAAGVLIIGSNVNAEPFYIIFFFSMADSCINPQ